jgi:hypothetical protein
MENKKPWLSKTLWINVIMAVVAFIPPVSAWIVAHPDVLVIGFTLVNVILRLVSKDKISLQD